MFLHQILIGASYAMGRQIARNFRAIFHHEFPPRRQHGRATQPPAFELLESRQLLSATPSAAPSIASVRQDATQAAATPSKVAGFSPAAISAAYGFNSISFNGGTVAANGAGQTIAIVDAYSDPNLKSDLSVFDQHFGIGAPPSLKIVNQTGGIALPASDAGWAAEISLDVEWAHAMAPAARILLVEANAATNADLLAAVNYARKAAGVSVVSMSWGGSEFVSYSGSESPSQRALDKTFATPARHTAVTFVASAGDSGFSNGVQWPASSPNILSVGGTTLSATSNGIYFGEKAWKGFAEGTSGGFSKYEPEPAYQRVAQQSGQRSIPDVAYDADPSTGFAIYDSLSNQGTSGWQLVGGTSAGAPQWAALIAIADQGRALAGEGTLDGTGETLPALYSVYSNAGTSGYAAYTSYFHNIGAGGYGLSTGLGSPQAAAIVALLESYNPSVSAIPTASPIAISLVSSPTSSAAGGSVRLRLTNTNSTPFRAQVAIKIYASADGTLSPDDTTLATVLHAPVKLPPRASRMETLKLKYPAGLAAGSYNIIATVTASGDEPVQVVSAAKLTVA